MKKSERKFLVALIILFLAYVGTTFLAPKEIDWTVTFLNKDKNPFGSYILHERFEDLFDEDVAISYKTISELDGLSNLIILSNRASIESVDYEKLIDEVSNGAHVFIAANQFSTAFQDSMEIYLSFSFHILNQGLFEEAKSVIKLWDSVEYEYPFSLVSNYFELHNDVINWQILAKMDENPILISRKMGNGTLTLSSTPLIFTNFGLLYNDNHEAAEKILSLLPDEKTDFTFFYHLGKAEASTPLRYFLSQDSLRWSIYLSLFTIIVFLLISSRRTQRPMPVILPPVNATVQYVQTLGALFFRESNHKKAAERHIYYFLRLISEKYFIKVDYTERFYQLLSAKSTVAIQEVIQTFELIAVIRRQPRISEQTLIQLNKKLELFK